MNRFALTAILSALLAGTAFEAKAASLIANGGFETGDFTDWTVNNSGGCCVAVDQLSSGVGYGPNSGTYFAYIGTTDTSNISQTFTDTAGGTLEVSFYYASNGDLNPIPPDSNQLNALFNGTTEFTQTNIGSTGTNAGSTIPLYVLETFSVVATGSDTLEFSFFDVPSALALDDVSVTEEVSTTPLPAALPLFVSGLGAFGFIVGRRKRKTSPAIVA
jgi:hypothetical protein